MEEACRIAHAKLIFGTCPWCGRSIVNGQAFDPVESLDQLFTARHRSGFLTLKNIVRSRGPLDPTTAVQYLLGAAIQLEAQFLNTPHRNISPETILVNSSGAILLGPSSELEEGIAVEETESVLGVADYLAPEQALNSRRLDQRTDIYSLGCSLYFILTGRPPFQGSPISEVLLKHQTETPVSAHEINPRVPESLAQICQKMMAKKPADRYHSMLELRTALDAWQDE